uniref:dual-specificity kinase n=1 Tax=Inonotus obliquus TaxID=167356 RepID=A0A345BJX0_9AGAM|nr:protein kinase [Inonotus obliquus]
MSVSPSSSPPKHESSTTDSDFIVSPSFHQDDRADDIGSSPPTAKMQSLASLHIPSVLVKDANTESESEIPRSTSATSSLDPYYFTIPSRNGSPVPPLPLALDINRHEIRPIREPSTPVRDPASIDRNDLVGVGELRTPRWPKLPSSEESLPHFSVGIRVGANRDDDDDYRDASDEDNDRDSPWTIEAVDGEQDDSEQPADGSFADRTRLSRTQSSIPDESGGEEILYPRKPLQIDVSKEPLLKKGSREGSVQGVSPSVPTSPPSSFPSPARRARKRSSDEFALDQAGLLSSKLKSNIGSGLTGEGRQEEIPMQTKHQSVAFIQPSSTSTVRDRRRGGSMRISMVATSKSGLAQAKIGKHSRQQSASSIASNHVDGLRRRPSTSDVNASSPTSATHLRRTSGPSVRASSEKLSLLKEKDVHSPAHVAHSLLRGTQEGWSGLNDDDATAEALRKLDGISGKGPRSRGSVRATSRSSNNSRPGTPASRGHRSEGNEGADKLYRMNSVGSHRIREKHHSGPIVASDKESQTRELDEKPTTGEPSVNGADGPASGGPNPEAESKKHTSVVRLSYNQKRGSASSTNFTGTPTSGSRDSANLSASTSGTSASAGSQRLSLIKLRRNSAGSDISSIHSEVSSHKDRTSGLGDIADEGSVPPVPPLPKDLSSYKTPPQSSTSLAFPAPEPIPDGEKDNDRDAIGRSRPQEEPGRNQTSDSSTAKVDMGTAQRVHDTSAAGQPITKTPSKKWSFSNPLNIRHSHSNSPGRHEPANVKSPSGRARLTKADKQLRPSSSKESGLMSVISPKSSMEAWQSIQKVAMASETSLASLSSLSSLPEPSPPISPVHSGHAPAQGEDQLPPSRSETASSHGASHASYLDSQVSHGSPSSKVPSRDVANKRLTPSSIPFFRRSSSHSMQAPSAPAAGGMTGSPTSTSAPHAHHSGLRTDGANQKDRTPISPTTPGFSQRKSSMLTLGLPSILKGSSSRKSLQVDRSLISTREQEKLRRPKESDSEHTKSKKDDKDRSESRISVLMGRKRGKTLSSTDQKKVKPITLPPMQVSALPQATADRIAHVKPFAPSSPSIVTRTITSSRLTSQTISSMHKQSDSSLRSSRQQLPTIAGSPSVGVHGVTGTQNGWKDSKEQPFVTQSTSISGSMSSAPKETPTRIPRIASRSSTVTSPAMKHSSSFLGSRRKSANVSGIDVNTEAGESGMDESLNEFGVLDNVDEPATSQASLRTYRHSFRPSSPSSTKLMRHQTQPSLHSNVSANTPRKPIHDSLGIKGLRKSSTGSVTSMTSAAIEQQQHNALSALSPSKGLNKLLSPKMSLPGARLSGSSTTPNLFRQQSNGSPTSHRQSFSTPSPVPSSVDEDEILGDEEMMQYVKRTQARQLAQGAKRNDLDELLKFPEPIPPGRSNSPATILNGDQVTQLSDYERKEILDYPSIYYIGNRNEKKLATRDSSSNNYGYDDDRGDYLVINHDHLAYRYEIVNTLGKGSFGQVLQCRDHCTGESVAIKIIRNKKRFHHQALVEIKILENLRKWDPDERHHVIRMTEHFYFRNHLCIAMELLSINLYELIKANGFAGFSTTLIRRFTSQMLLSLSLMRHHRIVHCDLKPENVLLRHPAKSAIKVIDFGSSCLEHEKVYTYIQSRFYRSPEVILGMNYSMAIDMWSLGCILAELFTGYPIFPGENEQEQLACIMEVLGVPEKELINRSSRKRLFFDSTGLPRPVVNSKGRRRRPGSKTLAQVLRCDDELFVDFVAKCLSWDPERRLKPQSALRHPFITAGRKAKIINNAIPGSPRHHNPSSSLLTPGRSKPTDTPKKPQISAPTPLTARSARTSSQVTSGPLSSLAHSAQGSSKSFRSLHAHYHSGRSANGLAVSPPSR